MVYVETGGFPCEGDGIQSSKKYRKCRIFFVLQWENKIDQIRAPVDIHIFWYDHMNNNLSFSFMQELHLTNKYLIWEWAKPKKYMEQPP